MRARSSSFSRTLSIRSTMPRRLIPSSFEMSNPAWGVQPYPRPRRIARLGHGVGGGGGGGGGGPGGGGGGGAGGGGGGGGGAGGGGRRRLRRGRGGRRGVRRRAVRGRRAGRTRDRHAVVVGGREGLDRHVRERLRHEVVPDPGGNRAPENGRVALDVLHRQLAVWVAHPDAGDKLRHVAAEPGVLVVLRRPRLTRGRPADIGRRPGSVRDHALERGGDEVGVVRRDDAVTRRERPRQDPAVRGPHELERLRVVPDPVRGEGS